MRLPLSRESAVSTLRVLACILVPLSTLLAFLLQPLVSQILAPTHGNSTGLFGSLGLYFLVALLIGCVFAMVIRRAAPQTKLWLILGLCGVALIGTHLPEATSIEAQDGAGMVMGMALRTLPILALLFLIPAVLQRWLFELTGRECYELFALAFAGAMLAQLVYSLFLERALMLDLQVTLWVAFALLATASLAVAVYLRHFILQPVETADPRDKAPSMRSMVAWVLLAAAGMAVARATTVHFATEIGEQTFSAMLPHALFFGALALCFADWWLPIFDKPLLVVGFVGLVEFTLAKGGRFTTVNAGAAFWMVVLCLASSLVVARLLRGLRPQAYFERFYLCLGLGFLLGHFFVMDLGPLLFSRPSELLVVSTIILGIGAFQLLDISDFKGRVLLGVILAFPILAIWDFQTRETIAQDKVVFYRDNPSLLAVRMVKSGVILSTDNSTRATQLQEDEAGRGHPTLYYSESSAIGIVVGHLQAASPGYNAAIIGLGGGTMAAYARKGDLYRFFESDAKTISVASQYFTYIKDSYGKIEVAQSDGRVALSKDRTDYSLVMIDCFEGNNIPTHLLTREALQLYEARLLSKQGLLVIHTSNRYFNYFPMLAANAVSLDLEAIEVRTDVSKPTQKLDFDGTKSYYVIICHRDQAANVASWFKASEDEGRVTRQVTRGTQQVIAGTQPWSDAKRSLVDIFDLERFVGVR